MENRAFAPGANARLHNISKCIVFQRCHGVKGKTHPIKCESRCIDKPAHYVQAHQGILFSANA